MTHMQLWRTGMGAGRSELAIAANLKEEEIISFEKGLATPTRAQERRWVKALARYERIKRAV